MDFKDHFLQGGGQGLHPVQGGAGKVDDGGHGRAETVPIALGQVEMGKHGFKPGLGPCPVTGQEPGQEIRIISTVRCNGGGLGQGHKIQGRAQKGQGQGLMGRRNIGTAVGHGIVDGFHAQPGPGIGLGLIHESSQDSGIAGKKGLDLAQGGTGRGYGSVIQLGNHCGRKGGHPVVEPGGRGSDMGHLPLDLIPGVGKGAVGL